MDMDSSRLASWLLLLMRIGADAGPLDFLECTGPSFAPEWPQFQQRLLEDMSLNRVRTSTLTKAVDIVQENEERLGLTEHIYSILKGEAVEHALEGFCFLGVLSAIVVLLRPEARDMGLTQSHQDNLAWRFTSLLGYGRPLDLFAETRWPIRSSDVLTVLTDPRFPSLQVALDDRPQTWQPRFVMERVRWQLVALVEPTAVRPLRYIRAAVFGTHAMMALEPVFTLNALVAQHLHLRFEFGHFGQWAYCGQLGTGSTHDCDEPITKLFASWFQDERSLESESDLLSQFYSLYSGNAFLSTVDLLVVTRPYLVGWLLRAVDPTTPILHVYDCPLLFGTPKSWRVPLMLSVRALIRQGPISRQDAIVQIAGPYCSATIREQVGESMLYLPMLSLYVDRKYTPGPVSRVMLFRSPFWHSMPGFSFRGVFDRLLKDSILPFEVLHPPEEYWGWTELCTLHAVALFPDNLNKGQFYDFYMMGMPLFLPSASLFTRIACSVNDFNDNKPVFRDFLHAGSGRSTGSFDPFFNCSTVSSRFFSVTPFILYELTDYALYPHLNYFDSARELVAHLAAPDVHSQLAERSRAMVAHGNELRERAADFFSRAVNALLS